MPTLEELLGSPDEETQIAIVQDLLEQERTSPKAMLIRYDVERDGVELNIIGNMPYPLLYRMLEQANTAVRNGEMELVKEIARKEAEENPEEAEE